MMTEWERYNCNDDHNSNGDDGDNNDSVWLQWWLL